MSKHLAPTKMFSLRNSKPRILGRSSATYTPKTGYYQTKLANTYRGSGIFLRGGSLRNPTARLRRRRGMRSSRKTPTNRTIRKRGGGLVRGKGMGQRVQRRARII